jgi:hypothetical protein
MKLHELLNKIFEFVAQLKEDDLCGVRNLIDTYISNRETLNNLL